MKTNNSILFIVPFFGKWPVWMEIYLDSIRRNPSVNFFFITDCDIFLFDGIQNIMTDHTTFEEYITRYKKILGTDIKISNPYKICDLRPFFGIIHREEIRNFDFFGWCDVDLFFGDIRSFYTDEILSKNDVISTHSNRLSGHCALLRNNRYHRQIGFRIYNWKEALKNPEFIGIDEHGITNALKMNILDRLIEKLKLPINNFLLNFIRKYKTRKHYFIEQYTTPFTPIIWLDKSVNNDQPSKWYYHKGVITNDRDLNREFIYIHFMNFKSSTWRVHNSTAPWQKSFKYVIESLERKVIIDTNGISNI
jgi:hypothetical protein